MLDSQICPNHGECTFYLPGRGSVWWKIMGPTTESNRSNDWRSSNCESSLCSQLNKGNLPKGEKKSLHTTHSIQSCKDKSAFKQIKCLLSKLTWIWHAAHFPNLFTIYSHKQLKPGTLKSIPPCDVVFKTKGLLSPGKLIAREKESSFLSLQPVHTGLVGGIEVCSEHK